MLAFLKKWRQAYRDEKGDRLHAEVEAERNVLCDKPILKDSEAINALHDVSCGASVKKEVLDWMAAASQAMEDERNRERDY
ncbi:conserved hypothetical protein [Vibrio crassostreae]|nr:conserved hypothetical protein [Vibrio crassostreae]